MSADLHFIVAARRADRMRRTVYSIIALCAIAAVLVTLVLLTGCGAAADVCAASWNQNADGTFDGSVSGS